MKNRGWKKDSYRHSLASRGIRTGRAIPTFYDMDAGFTSDQRDQMLDVARYCGFRRETHREREERYDRLANWFESIGQEDRAPSRIILEFEFDDAKEVMAEVDDLDIPEEVKSRLRWKESAKEQKVYLWME